jgi:hypothetical protein
MNPNDKPATTRRTAPDNDDPKQQIAIRRSREPILLNPPEIHPELTTLPPLERTAEALRFAVLRLEYWLSPAGRLRQVLRLSLRFLVYLLIAVVIAPAVTSLLTQIKSWTGMSAGIVQDIAQIPLGLGKFLLASLAIVVLFRLLFRR